MILLECLLGFYFGSIDSNFEFTTSFLVKDGVNFRVDGTYSVKAHYDKSEAISFFDYYKVPLVVEDSSENQIDENEIMDEPINESTNNADTSNEMKMILILQSLRQLSLNKFQIMMLQVQKIFQRKLQSKKQMIWK